MTQVTLFSLHELAVRCDVDVTFVEQLVALGVISMHPGAPRAFPSEVSLRVAKLRRLQRDFNLDVEGAALVIDLLDRIEALEARLRHYEGR